MGNQTKTSETLFVLFFRFFSFGEMSSIVVDQKKKKGQKECTFA